MVAHETRRVQAENQQAIETALDVIEDELILSDKRRSSSCAPMWTR